ncbi:MAG: (d)CMP kinase [Psychroflexus maritimus]
MNKITIAVDGHSSTGKSTLAKQLAKKLHFIYVDTGAMYRAVTYFALENKLFENQKLNKEKLVAQLNQLEIDFQLNTNTNESQIHLNSTNVENKIRKMQVSQHVSIIAQLPEVRHKLVEIQQEMGKYGGIVMDGRDIGTVVFPGAELKLFMTASAKTRAQRRFEELQTKGEEITYKEVYDNLIERDEIDSNRAHSPLKKAEDAVLIDNSNLSLEEQFEMIKALVNCRTKK